MTAPKGVTISEPVAGLLRQLLAGIQVPITAADFEQTAALIVQAKKELGGFPEQ